MIPPKPPVYPKPKPAPKRWPPRDAMTIAAGFLCTDGILISADTEHTGGDSHKFEQSKVRRETDAAFGNYVIVGAGHSSYISMASDMIEEAFYRSRSKAGNDNEAEREYRIRKLLLENSRGIQAHIRACHQEGQWVPTVELICGIHGSGFAPLLMHIDSDGAVHKVLSGPVFIGSGAPVATAFARIVCQEIFTLDLTKWIAFFLLYQTKLSGYGCGGSTEQFALPTPKPRRMTVYDETVIAERVERAMRLCLLDSVNPSVSREELAKKVDDLKGTLDQVKTATQEPDWAPFIMEEMRKLKAVDSTGKKSP